MLRPIYYVGSLNLLRRHHKPLKSGCENPQGDFKALLRKHYAKAKKKKTVGESVPKCTQNAQIHPSGALWNLYTRPFSSRSIENISKGFGA